MVAVFVISSISALTVSATFNESVIVVVPPMSAVFVMLKALA
jgi:hypothetical protein